jgi:hypothetical protein
VRHTGAHRRHQHGQHSARRHVALSPNCVYTITTPATATDGLPVITGAISIIGGPNTTIRRDPAAAAAFRVMEVAAGASLRVSGISITDGGTTALGGGVLNNGTLRLDRVTLAGNSAASGGGLVNLANATAVVSRSELNGNRAGGAVGGAILDFGELTVFASRLSANTAPINGGGIDIQPAGNAHVIRSTIDHNASGSLGGGMANLGTVLLERTLVTLNRGSSGGGIATANARSRSSGCV